MWGQRNLEDSVIDEVRLVILIIIEAALAVAGAFYVIIYNMGYA